MHLTFDWSLASAVIAKRLGKSSCYESDAAFIAGEETFTQTSTHEKGGAICATVLRSPTISQPGFDLGNLKSPDPSLFSICTPCVLMLPGFYSQEFVDLLTSQ
eukprot:6296070-Amphidinium_carterae.1